MSPNAISVIIPLYNKELEIANAIQSVLNQTHTCYELIIVNDGSTDDSRRIVTTFSDPRIRLFDKENGGVSSARNFGIKNAAFDWIAFLDGDDRWGENFLSILLALRDKFPSAAIYGGQYLEVNHNGPLAHPKRFPPIEEGYFQVESYIHAIHSSSIILRKDVFKSCGLFDENLIQGEDKDMWIRIGMKHKACYTNKIVSFYYTYGNPLRKSFGRIPKIENHLLSKLDLYIGTCGIEWDEALLNLKIKYLEKFYLIYPFNKEIRRLLESLPGDSLISLSKSYLKKNRATVVFISFLKRLQLLVRFVINKIRLLHLKYLLRYKPEVDK
ncbi:MAG TPA: glycosyltransferase family A protein [Saprospiraceae bacterium]|nr:glycosyltransferase family A protein [Saprospiraceae bacterium]